MGINRGHTRSFHNPNIFVFSLSTTTTNIRTNFLCVISTVDGYSPVAIVSATPNPQPPAPSKHQTQASMITSLDGNVQLQDTPTTIGINKIKINIKKNVTKTVIKPSDSNLGKPSELAASNATVPHKEDEEITFEYKDTMKGSNFKKLPAVRSGTETSGLCTIM